MDTKIKTCTRCKNLRNFHNFTSIPGALRGAQFARTVTKNSINCGEKRIENKDCCMTGNTDEHTATG